LDRDGFAGGVAQDPIFIVVGSILKEDGFLDNFIDAQFFQQMLSLLDNSIHNDK
jgi:hypothetical protein